MTNKLSSTHRKIIALASLGGALELFDFTIYAFFARYISLNFFPHDNAWLGLLNTFAIFLVGYGARPLGGVLFGHFGDKYGRKNTFAFAAFFMAFTTLLMGCLPTYSQIGIFAPLLLLLLRILQGISVGGEVPGATVFTVEHLYFHRSGFAIGLIFMGLTLGNVMSSALGFGLTSVLNENEMLSWGWRIPFVSGFFLGTVAYLLRRKAAETPIFLALAENARLHQVPALKLFQSALSPLFKSISLTALPAVTVFFFLYLPSYPLVQAFYQPHEIYLFNILSFTSLAIFTAIFGLCSDYIERKKIMLAGTVLAIVMSYFFVNIIQSHHLSLFLMSGILFSAVIAIVNGCYARAIVELFPSPIRYSGMAITYNLGFAIFGGTAPLLMTALYKLTQNHLAPFFFLLCGYMITLLGTTTLKSDSKSVLSDQEVTS